MFTLACSCPPPSLSCYTSLHLVPPTVDQWNMVKLLVGVCIAFLHACMHNANKTWTHSKNILHSVTSNFPVFGTEKLCKVASE